MSVRLLMMMILKLMLNFWDWESLLTNLGRDGEEVAINRSEGSETCHEGHAYRCERKSSLGFAVGPQLTPAPKAKCWATSLPGCRVQMAVFCKAARITSPCVGWFRHFPKPDWQAWDHTQTRYLKGWCIRMRKKPFNPVESHCFEVRVLQQDQGHCVTWSLVGISQTLKWVC